ncbi:MAG: restriction endonuclease subunit S [Bacteroidales bacterium]|nr:restriction endonuclease subunit S [Bacteroidales bacterium]MDD6508848.1 restriction endonuclease subunit S [Bacteroidales bacterium]MDD6809487.1 restriction endonuclease subunit S [Bacteroidales bacterium]
MTVNQRVAGSSPASGAKKGQSFELRFCPFLFSCNSSDFAAGWTFLTIPMMKNMRIIIPPLDIQNTYAERIATTEIEKELIKIYTGIRNDIQQQDGILV